MALLIWCNGQQTEKNRLIRAVWSVYIVCSYILDWWNFSVSVHNHLKLFLLPQLSKSFILEGIIPLANNLNKFNNFEYLKLIFNTSQCDRVTVWPDNLRKTNIFLIYNTWTMYVSPHMMYVCHITVNCPSEKKHRVVINEKPHYRDRTLPYWTLPYFYCCLSYFSNTIIHMKFQCSMSNTFNHLYELFICIRIKQ